MAPKKIFFLEGNIGAGKSTLLKCLDDRYYNIIDEPMEDFCNLGPFNPLDMFYKNEISNFQLSTYISSLFINILLTKTVDNRINIICRNVFTTVFCFAQLSKNKREMSDIEYSILLEFTKIYKKLLQSYDVKIIYLDVEPEICFQRLRKRNRKEESMVQFEYIKELGDIYNHFIYNIISYPKVILDGSKSPKEIKEVFLKQM